VHNRNLSGKSRGYAVSKGTLWAKPILHGILIPIICLKRSIIRRANASVAAVPGIFNLLKINSEVKQDFFGKNNQTQPLSK
jgi:hypothetical protein